MAPLSHFLTAALAVVGASAASAVIDLIPDNFDDVVFNSGKPALVEFFAPWCGHCKTLAPIYEELAGNFEFAKDKVTIAKVDADNHRDLGKKYGVQGFPTLKWFDGKSKDPVDYNSGRDLDSLSAFLTEKTSLKPKVKKISSNVEMLNDASFTQKVGSDQDVIVAFTAPWCGHCKSLAPIWEQVASDFSSESGVLVAKVDCENEMSKETAKLYEVTSYPTIKYFPKGSLESVAYHGGRTELDIVNFLNEKAGTFRAPGGGLNSLAGIIPSLDTVVANLRTYGGDKAYAEFNKQVAKAKGTYAEYYTKVANKMKENSEYVEKEVKRLQNMIKKGGISQGKLDDLISRSNILRKFQAQEDDDLTPKVEL